MKRLAILVLVAAVAATSIPSSVYAVEFKRPEQSNIENNRHRRPNHRPNRGRNHHSGAKIGAAAGIGAIVGTVIGMGIANSSKPKQQTNYYYVPQPQPQYYHQPTLVYDPVTGCYYYR